MRGQDLGRVAGRIGRGRGDRFARRDLPGHDDVEGGVAVAVGRRETRSQIRLRLQERPRPRGTGGLEWKSSVYSVLGALCSTPWTCVPVPEGRIVAAELTCGEFCSSVRSRVGVSGVIRIRSAEPEVDRERRQARQVRCRAVGMDRVAPDDVAGREGDVEERNAVRPVEGDDIALGGDRAADHAVGTGDATDAPGPVPEWKNAGRVRSDEVALHHDVRREREIDAGAAVRGDHVALPGARSSESGWLAADAHASPPLPSAFVPDALRPTRFPWMTPPPETMMPALVFEEMTLFRIATSTPNELRCTPLRLGSASSPDTSTPIRFPRTWVPGTGASSSRSWLPEIRLRSASAAPPIVLEAPLA